jgi:hypothetical protein
VADLSAIFADFGLMEKLLAEWKNPIRPLNPFWPNEIIEFGQLQKWPNLSYLRQNFVRNGPIS